MLTAWRILLYSTAGLVLHGLPALAQQDPHFPHAMLGTGADQDRWPRVQ